jgi:protein TonB
VNSISPRNLSLIIHSSFILVFLLITQTKVKPQLDYLNVPVVYDPKVEPSNITEVKKETKVVLKSINKVEASKVPAREVFGLNRNSYTDNSAGSTGIAVKAGNTIAKVSDTEILKASDSDSLPTPTEEYLVSQMPKVLSEVKPVYPKEARDKKIEGTVALDVLIDEKGTVRQVKVVEGDAIFRSEALEAMKKFKFAPANVSGKAVAVKIRYKINFKLEY